MNEEIPEFFWNVLKARFGKMPENLKIVIGGFGSLTKNEILECLEKRDEIGILLAKMELEYLRLFKQEAESYESFDDKTKL